MGTGPVFVRFEELDESDYLNFQGARPEACYLAHFPYLQVKT